jgi:RNA polymerase primary sigma factor
MRRVSESTLQTYLKEINQVPLLTPEEEKDLATRVGKGDQEARDKMIRANLRLVVNIAKNYINRGLALMDLIEEGNLGLMRAVKGFDPKQGHRFSTYASWWIKQAIKRALINKTKTIRIPAYMVEMVARWKSTAAQLANRFGRPPSLEEIAEEMDVAPEKIQIIKRAISTVSSDSQQYGSDGEWSIIEMQKDERVKAPDEELFDSYEREVIEQLLDAIDDREAKVLKMRFGLDNEEPMTLKEIGKALNLTRERIRQIENEALRKLNAIMSGKGLE